MPAVLRDDEQRNPVFPVMLERIIFEMAVEDIVLPPSRFATNLQLTARRVRLWFVTGYSIPIVSVNIEN